MSVDVSALVTENLDIWSSTIKAKNSQGHGSSKKTELYGIKKLRELILSNQSEVWLEKYLNSQFSRDYFAGSSKQTTNLASINTTQLRGCLIAVPPSSEKEKIVETLDQLITLCDTILERIKASQITQLNLTDAIAEQAIG